jgi:hypothetical protein
MNKSRCILILVGFLTTTHAQEIPPELTQLKAPYVQAISTIRANAEARAKPFVASYLAALSRMEKQFASDPVLSVMLVQDMERVGAGKVPTAADVAKFSPALQQLRAKFDADMKATKAPFVQQETQYTRQYLTSLSTLERRFASQNLIVKAAAVTEEIQKVNGLATNSAKEERMKAESTVKAGTAKAIGTLDSALAAKIAAAKDAKAYTRTANSKQVGGTEGWATVPDDGGLLVGFEFFQPSGKGDSASIRSMRPYFLTNEGVVPATDRGTMERVTNKIMAKPGYAIAGLYVGEEKEIQAVFMKINLATGGYFTDAANTYKSQSYGKEGKGKPKLLGGDGRLVIGVYGKTGSDCDDLGLILMNKP